jgi:glycerophosphoryl diester phosphodiesterase
MPGLDWLTARPVAHRGLHDQASGIIENTASAIRAAIAANYAIEVDVQLSADGEAMVHHDDALGRLTEGAERLRDMNTADLKRIAFKQTADRMMSVSDLCALVSGWVTLLIELKSRFDGDRGLAARVVEVLTSYAGPVGVMSFDPQQIEAVKELAPGLPRGIVAERKFSHPEWKGLSIASKRSLAYLLHGLRSRPHFLAYAVKDLPAAAPLIARHVFGLPLLAWTVRNDEDRRRASWADQIIFEGFRP